MQQPGWGYYEHTRTETSDVIVGQLGRETYIRVLECDRPEYSYYYTCIYHFVIKNILILQKRIKSGYSPSQLPLHSARVPGIINAGWIKNTFSLAVGSYCTTLNRCTDEYVQISSYCNQSQSCTRCPQNIYGSAYLMLGG